MEKFLTWKEQQAILIPGTIWKAISIPKGYFLGIVEGEHVKLLSSLGELIIERDYWKRSATKGEMTVEQFLEHFVRTDE